MHHTRRRFLKTGAASAIGGFPAIVRAQSKITLKVAHYVPALHGLQRQVAKLQKA